MVWRRCEASRSAAPEPCLGKLAGFCPACTRVLALLVTTRNRCARWLALQSRVLTGPSPSALQRTWGCSQLLLSVVYVVWRCLEQRGTFCSSIGCDPHISGADTALGERPAGAGAPFIVCVPSYRYRDRLDMLVQQLAAFLLRGSMLANLAAWPNQPSLCSQQGRAQDQPHNHACRSLRHTVAEPRKARGYMSRQIRLICPTSRGRPSTPLPHMRPHAPTCAHKPGISPHACLTRAGAAPPAAARWRPAAVPPRWPP